MSVKRNSSMRVVGMRRVERASREEERSLSRRGVAGVVGRVASNVLATHLSSDVTWDATAFTIYAVLGFMVVLGWHEHDDKCAISDFKPVKPMHWRYFVNNGILW